MDEIDLDAIGTWLSWLILAGFLAWCLFSPPPVSEEEVWERELYGARGQSRGER